MLELDDIQHFLLTRPRIIPTAGWVGWQQNVWVNDRSFHELRNERDPIIGTQDGTLEYKIPHRPIRKRTVGLPAFTTVRGGAYFSCPESKR